MAIKNTPKGSLEQQVRARIDALSYLPTTASVAMKFVELGKRPDADPAEYARVISSDSSLSSKLLSLANSSWFGVRNKVTRPVVAVNLLGIGTVRTLAISYCLTGLHNDLHLSSEESRVFWAASLCKGVAAKQYAMITDKSVADEAFAAGLFQDFALPVMFACDKAAVQTLLDDPASHSVRLERERALFNLDHAELGRSIAQKLALPELFVDAIAFHHNAESLAEFVQQQALAEACTVASLFPHSLHSWNAEDAREVAAFLTARLAAHNVSSEEFLQRVQKEFDQLYAYFESEGTSDVCLSELLIEATREVADSTTRLVGTVNELLSQAAAAGREVRALMDEQDRLQEVAQRDPLTEVLNRHGFNDCATKLLAEAERYSMSLAIIYFDLNHFKEINDTFGHPYGDAVLKYVAAAMREALRPKDLVGRLGGDEFVILLPDCSRDQASKVIERISAQVGSSAPPCSAKIAKPPPHITLSAGLHWCQSHTAGDTLANLIAAADQIMYQTKRGGSGAKAA
jgi:diguanylate cyclase (GGDEF)-like protein